MSYPELPPYFQFEFTTRQREILVAYALRIRTRITSYQERFQQRGEVAGANPLSMYDYLLGELARFDRYLAANEYQKVGLSVKFLPWLTQEFELDLDGQTDELDLSPSRQNVTVPTAAQATVYELLQLYYRLTRGLIRHISLEVTDQLRESFIDESAKNQLRRMPKRRYIYTAGMDEVAVFTALYNGANPKSPTDPNYEQGNITIEEGADLLKRGDDFVDYIHNRRMKIMLQELFEGCIDVTNYDEGNGEGAAERAIAAIPRV